VWEEQMSHYGHIDGPKLHHHDFFGFKMSHLLYANQNVIYASAVFILVDVHDAVGDVVLLVFRFVEAIASGTTTIGKARKLSLLHCLDK
jgi:hypothetical protein